MSIKILLADDSVTIQKVIGIIFGGEDYSLLVVDNGADAVAKAIDFMPDVLLIDALMPGMSGYEVCEKIRLEPAVASRPILLLTGSFEPFDEERAKKCGADDFIAKPFESQQIISKINELLELGRSRGAAAAETSESPVSATMPDTFFAGPEPAPPAFSDSPPVETQPLVETPVKSDDIWGAFATVEEPAVPPPAPDTPFFSLPPEPDVFAIVSEDSDPGPTISKTAPGLDQQTGSAWIPVEESTFEFEEHVAEVPPSVLPVNPELIPDQAFGDISFEEAQPAPVSEPSSLPVEPVVSETLTSDFTPVGVTAPELLDGPVASAAPASLVSPMAATGQPLEFTEEQLKSAIAAVSKETIERIVWEVVPDLAETLIKEAIRRIREGE